MIKKPKGIFTCQKCSLNFERHKNYQENDNHTRGCPRCGHLYIKWDNYQELFESKFR